MVSRCAELNFLAEFHTFGFWAFLLLDRLSRVKEPSLSFYLSIDWGKIVEFITFQNVWAICLMHTSSSRIWTRVPVSISNDGKHCITHASLSLSLYIYIYICLGLQKWQPSMDVLLWTTAHWHSEKMYIHWPTRKDVQSLVQQGYLMQSEGTVKDEWEWVKRYRAISMIDDLSLSIYIYINMCVYVYVCVCVCVCVCLIKL